MLASGDPGRRPRDDGRVEHVVGCDETGGLEPTRDLDPRAAEQRGPLVLPVPRLLAFAERLPGQGRERHFRMNFADALVGAPLDLEDRPADEVRVLRGVRLAPLESPALNPAFDITPAELITAIVTEKGIVRAPYEVGLAEAVG